MTTVQAQSAVRVCSLTLSGGGGGGEREEGEGEGEERESCCFLCFILVIKLNKICQQ